MSQRLPPGPRRPPLVQAIHYAIDPFSFFARAAGRYGEVFTVRMMGDTWVVLGSPEAVKELHALKADEADAGAPNLALRPVLGTRNTLLMDGEEHLRRRRLVLPTFNGRSLVAYRALVRDVAERELERLPVRTPVRGLEAMEDLTFGVILRVVCGVEDAARMSAFGTQLRRLLSWSIDVRRALVFLALGPDRVAALGAYRRQRAAADRELLAEIERRRHAPDLAERRDVLSQLVRARDEDGARLTDEDLRDEIVTLLVAGHQTMTGILAWALHDLARDPGLQERVLREEGFSTAVVRETMRLHPAVPVAGIRRLRVARRIGGHDLPAGVTVAPCTALVHRRADLFPDPLAFRPDRFVPGRPSAGEWFPFGGGGRRCLGAGFAEQEMSLVLETVLRRFVVAPAGGRPERVGRRGVVLVPGSGARVVLVPREGAPPAPEAAAAGAGTSAQEAGVGA